MQNFSIVHTGYLGSIKAYQLSRLDNTQSFPFNRILHTSCQATLKLGPQPQMHLAPRYHVALRTLR